MAARFSPLIRLGWAAVCAFGMAGHGASADEAATAPQPPWSHPLKKRGYLGSPLVETTPFVWQDRLYLLENYQAFVDAPHPTPGANADRDALRIRDVESGRLVSVALEQHTFGTLFVWQDRAYIFASRCIDGQPWRTCRTVDMTSSADLVHWTEPRQVLAADGDEQIFNTAVCRGDGRFVLLYETNDRKYPAFTFKYCVSDDLVSWTRIDDGLYGKDKYVGGPALYFEGGWYYTLYLEALPETCYETRITRSRDLVHWRDAPAERPFLTFDRSHDHLPLRPPHLVETNASDAELCYFRGQTIVYFTGSDQQVAGDLQWATFDGTPRELFERFFADLPADPGQAP